jgi:hypothetical protein
MHIWQVLGRRATPEPKVPAKSERGDGWARILPRLSPYHGNSALGERPTEADSPLTLQGFGPKRHG